MQQPFTEIAKRMKELREIAGISREAFAKELKVEPDRYLAYEEGAEDIPVGVLLAAAGRHDVDVISLISGEEPLLKEYCIVRKGRGLDGERRKECRYRDLAYNFARR